MRSLRALARISACACRVSSGPPTWLVASVLLDKLDSLVALPAPVAAPLRLPRPRS